MTEPEPLQQIDRTCVLYRGRRLAYFAGCDYFRMASNRTVIRAAATSLKKDSLNVAASRLTTGNHQAYQELERKLAACFGAPSALLLPTGYLANLAVAQALCDEFTHAFIDDRAHPSLLDAAQLLNCTTVAFKHRDPADLAHHCLKLGKDSRPLLLTDGMFARDGQAAPLRQYVAVLPAHAWLLVDDCHGAGVLGMRGRGTLEHERVPRKNIIQTITLSKAFGAFGGAVLGPERLRCQIIERSQLFVGSTPFPPPLARAAAAALSKLQGRSAHRSRLQRNYQYALARLRAAGFNLPDSPGPIIPLYPTRPKTLQIVSKALLRAGVYPSFIRYPGGTPGGFFRFVISSEHRREQLDKLCDTLGACLPWLSCSE